MPSNSAIITLNLVREQKHVDLEIPLDISANELCSAVFKTYMPEKYGDMRGYYLKAEKPICLLRGERTLREYGFRDGSVINIT